MAVHESFDALEREGLSARAIAEICGVSSRTVVRWRHATGKTLSRRWPLYAWNQTQAGKFAAMVRRVERGWREDITDAC
ncbi:helix-turn-helix domain-containing protein [Microbacterium sp. KSW4-4]|uniref:helix-turn-helix domain-containing protein n=1 Tax=Microbacterium sp. KSW4-4 TaxID=2851651 RepID=UPI0035ABD1E9|nr:helix-turn-helix domain-containing protein [Microbacterium sp. KSW4-4]